MTNHLSGPGEVTLLAAVLLSSSLCTCGRQLSRSALRSTQQSNIGTYLFGATSESSSLDNWRVNLQTNFGSLTNMRNKALRPRQWEAKKDFKLRRDKPLMLEVPRVEAQSPPSLLLSQRTKSKSARHGHAPTHTLVSIRRPDTPGRRNVSLVIILCFILSVKHCGS